MKLLLLSDTHQNMAATSEWPYPLPDHDVLILAGDISEYTGKPGNLTEVLADFRGRTQSPILFLPGNHEFYRGEYYAGLDRMRADAKSLGIEFLHCRSLQYGDVAFHGCTLWSDFTLYGEAQAPLRALDAQMCLSDFSQIRFKDRMYLHTDCAQLFRQERAWLSDSLGASSAAHNVVITHFAPSAQCISQRFQGDPLNPYFIGCCEPLVERFAPNLWLYGHTHDARDFTYGKTRFINNARGYPEESSITGFDPEKTIEIGEAGSAVFVAQ